MKTFIVFGLFTICCVSLVTGYGHSHSRSSYAKTNNGGDGGGDGGHSGGGGGDVGHGSDGGDGGYGGHEDHHVDYYAYPKYKYEYGVEDHHTGDNHNHWEHRDGDSVKGGYTIAEPDGTKRIVEYSADKHSGFHAIVTKVGHADHPSLYGNGGSHDGYEAGGGAGHSGGSGDAGHGFGFTHGH